MPIDAWLPIGFQLLGGLRTRVAIGEGADYQIYDLAPEGRALIARPKLATRWEVLGLPPGALSTFSFGESSFGLLVSGARHYLGPVDSGAPAADAAGALAFATALRETRRAEAKASLHDAVYVERFSRLLPIFSLTSPVPDDQVLGGWLTGGVCVSALSTRRLASLVKGLSESELRPIVEAAGLQLVRDIPGSSGIAGNPKPKTACEPGAAPRKPFSLPGREKLERFFSEHVIDIVQHPDRYRSMGIEFPSAIALSGPPGSGKTFAVEKVIEYLGWPSWSVDSSSIGSPYIHETGRKIAQVFDDAIGAAPSVVVIDEMEAFLTDRQAAGSAQHRVEEVAEFLRRIPEAIKGRVLVVGMTNRIEMIDPAILRRGRFDHVIEVGMPTADEVRSLLQKLLADIPRDGSVAIEGLVEALSGRALSDAAFVVREGARLAARASRTSVSQEHLVEALDALPPSGPAEPASRTIGFR